MKILDIKRNDMIENIKKNMDQAKALHEKYTNASYEQAIKNLQPGQPAPEKGFFYDDENMDAYNAAMDQLSAKSVESIAAFMKEFSDQAVTEPTEEALRAVQMFVLIDPAVITKEDFQNRVDDMIARYGESMLTYDTIKNFAAKHGYYIEDHPQAKIRRNVKEIEPTVIKYFKDCHVSFYGEKPLFANGYLDLVKMSIENLAAGRDIFESAPAE